MKSQIRILAIDDGSFSFEEIKTPVVGVAMRLPGYVEGVMISDVEVDGTNSTDQLLKMLAGSRYLDQLKLIMLDGAALGGFNVVDVSRIYNELDVPVITVTRDKPNYDDIEKALRKHFEDWEIRLAMMRKVEPEEYQVGESKIWIGRAGIEASEVEEILELATVQGALPEALRIAHLIASAISRGESRGRA
ncbi:MAG: DUF99 family protein [Thermoplasmata archaeon]|nr:DUF99 family protein [Thermoplasmata archaeon]